MTLVSKEQRDRLNVLNDKRDRTQEEEVELAALVKADKENGGEGQGTF